MKRFFLLLPLVSCFGIPANAQSSNCTYLSASLTGDLQNWDQYNRYIASEMKTWTVTCKNTNNNTQTYSGTNSVTATGDGGWDYWGTTFIACNPIFGYVLSNPPTTASNNYFENVGQDNTYSGAASGYKCYPAAYHVNYTYCAAVACTTSSSPPPACPGGGGGGARTSVPSWNYGHFVLTAAGQIGDPSGPCSPIIIDVSGDGFALTDAQHGVQFDIAGTGHPVQLAWTAPGARNAFLCLPDRDGKCDDGKDLFGNFTPQPASSNPNGFAALAVYDDPENGGNSDGTIDAKDAVFESLRLWIDENHDGISQSSELYTLSSLGVHAISLKYKESRRTDQYGNVFRYRAAVNPTTGTNVGRMAYDIFLIGSGSPSNMKFDIRPCAPGATTAWLARYDSYDSNVGVLKKDDSKATAGF